MISQKHLNVVQMVSVVQAYNTNKRIEDQTMTEKQTIWLRLGVSIDVTGEDPKDWEQMPRVMLKQALIDGRVKLDGNTYSPPDLDNEDFFKHDNEAIDTDIYPTDETHITFVKTPKAAI